MKSILILAHTLDVGAQRLASELGAGCTRVLRPEALGVARWSHRVDSRGYAVTRLSWPNDLLESSSVGAVLNRIQYLPVSQFRNASPKDRDYAGAELHALVTSWLAGFGDAALHNVRRHPWIVPNLPRQHWLERAAEAGLPVVPLSVVSGPRAHRLTSHYPPPSAASTYQGSVIVAGDRTGGSLVTEFGDRCVAVARDLGFPILEFSFTSKGLNTIDAHPTLTEPWSCSLIAELLRRTAAGKTS